MKNSIKKLISLILLCSSFGLFAIRGGGGHGGGFHGGGHHGGFGGHHGGGFHGGFGGHHGGFGGHPGYHGGFGGHHGGYGKHHVGHYGRHGGFYGGRGWGRGRGLGGLGFIAGLTGAAIIGDRFYYNGYPVQYWQQYDPNTYQTVVLPAYRRWQTNPRSVPVRNDLVPRARTQEVYE